jgi:hypothetical protein
MPTFESFTPTSAISPETIARHADAVPSALTELWREHGAGLVGDGFLRVVDPDRALTMLDGILGMPPGTVPAFTTAMADVIVYIAPAFHVLRFRFGVVDPLGIDAATLFAQLEDETYQDRVLARQPYPAAVQRLGVPGPDECFGYVPLLALGGRQDPANLDRGGLWEHLAVVMQFAGPPQPRQA